MISDRLGSLADWCLGLAAKGHELHPDGLAILAKLLLDLSRQTKILEALPFDQTHGLDHHDE